METEQSKPRGLEDVRLAFLRQHTLLSELMDELDALAKGVLEGKDCSGVLNDALVFFQRRFLRHLDFEEEQLGALLEVLRPKAAASLRASMAEHADQRDRIDGLMHDRSVFNDTSTLAHEAITFVHLIRADIAEEDAALHTLA